MNLSRAACVLAGWAACGAVLLGCPLPDGTMDAGADAGPPSQSGPLRVLSERITDEGPDLASLEPAPGTTPARWYQAPPVWLDAEGTTGTLTLDLDEASTSFQLLALAPEPDQVVIPTRVVAPDGTVWVTGDADDPAPGHTISSQGFPGQLLSPNRVLLKVGLGSWTFPATPDLAFDAGRWELEIGVYGAPDEDWNRAPASGAVALAVLLSPARPSTLRVVVHIAHGDVAAADAAEHPVIGPAMDSFVNLLEDAAIAVEPLTWRDVEDPSLRTITLDDDVCGGGDLLPLFASSGDEDGALHLFLVERFFCVIGDGTIDVGEQIGGLTGGLPGPGPIAGTAQSGVAVAVAFADDDPARLSQVVAHEVGHYLGLFHTRERSRFDAPDVFDIIDDTPEEEPGVSANLMYFVAQEDSTLTEGQKAVWRSALGGGP